MGNFRQGNDRGGFGGNRGRSGGNRGGGRSGGFSGSRGGFGGNRDGGFSRGRDSGRTEMHDAICNKCKQECQVPFRPTGNKPVLCSNCFKGGDSGNSFRERDSRPMAGAGAGASSEQFKRIEAKLDKILAVLSELEIDVGEDDDEEEDDNDDEEDFEEDTDDSEEPIEPDTSDDSGDDEEDDSEEK